MVAGLPHVQPGGVREPRAELLRLLLHRHTQQVRLAPERGLGIDPLTSMSLDGRGSRPTESFTFATRNSYKAYQAIMSARSGTVSHAA